MYAINSYASPGMAGMQPLYNTQLAGTPARRPSYDARAAAYINACRAAIAARESVATSRDRVPSGSFSSVTSISGLDAMRSTTPPASAAHEANAPADDALPGFWKSLAGVCCACFFPARVT